LPRNGAAVNSGSNVTSIVPQPSNQSSATAEAISNEYPQGASITAGTVADELDQLENEVIHFMSISMEEKEKSEVLSGRLESVAQEKKDLERQIDELDQDLSRNGWPDQDDCDSAIEAGDTISRVSSKITNLRTSAQKMESDFKSLAAASDRQTKTIDRLEEQLRNRRQQLAQKTQEENRLLKELQQTKETVRAEKHTNEKLLGRMKAVEKECNALRVWHDLTGKKLAESEQTRETLSGLVKRKITELENVQNAGAAQAETMRQELDRKQKEIESLLTTQNDLVARCKQSEAASLEKSQTISGLQIQLASQQQPILRLRPIPGNAGMIPEAAPARRAIEKKSALIKDLIKDLRRNQQRRMRAVAIGIDLSGSAAGSLEDGIKRVYVHLLDTLQASLCKTYVMTVIHGPGDTATIKSNFGDTWEVHARVLEGQKADGMEQHVECLRKVKAAAVSHGLILDLQVVLLGDSQTQQASHVGAHEVCADFKSSNPPVLIHSVTVKTGSAEEADKYWGGLEAWTPWNYASNTRGNMTVWFQNNPLPDLSDLVY
jgi:hypothetical protein